MTHPLIERLNVVVEYEKAKARIAELETIIKVSSSIPINRFLGYADAYSIRLKNLDIRVDDAAKKGAGK